MFQYSCLIGVAARNNMQPIIPDNIDLLDIFNLPTPQGSRSLLRNAITYPDELSAKYDNKTEHLKPGHDAFIKGEEKHYNLYRFLFFRYSIVCRLECTMKNDSL